MTIYSLQQLFNEFLNSKEKFLPHRELTGKEWIEERKETYQIYKQKFSSGAIEKLKEEDFKVFLTFRVNKSWTCLHRHRKDLLQDINRLKEIILYLQNETIPVEIRLNKVLSKGEFYIKYFGKNLATGLLHIFNWHKYGVWNNCSQKALKYLGRMPFISSDLGLSYLRFNNELQNLAKEINTDLAYLDGFLWWLIKLRKLRNLDTKNLERIDFYIESPMVEKITEDFRLIAELELKLREFIFENLKSYYGNENDGWYKGVPENIRKECAARSEEERSREPKNRYLNFPDYVTILEKNWNDIFKKYFIFDKSDASKSKEKHLEFLSKIRVIRNTICHIRRSLYSDEQKELKNALEHFNKIYNRWKEERE